MRVSGPPGSEKTTLVASYLDRRRSESCWYQLDPSDSDVATFFYYSANKIPTVIIQAYGFRYRKSPATA